ncbi:MAG TPA: hypothetical protein VMS86_07565 [Thermoanaerobaculia bacterium]|nr:hypothetical protein [Thermoanaerobaculia bacterium]
MSRMRSATLAKAGILTLVGFLGLLGAGPAPAAGPEWTSVDPPASPTALAPRLTSSGDDLLLSWLEEQADGGGHRFLVSRLDHDAFAAPEIIHESAAIFANWVDVPGVAVLPAGGERVAWWLEHLEGAAHAYGVRLARSVGDGQPWTAGDWLHEDRSLVEHGFVSLVARSARAFWLDGRDMSTGGDSALLARRLHRPDTREIVLDPRVCECCSTDAAFGHEGPIVAYRDRSDDEVRDIAVVRETGSGFSAPLIVHADGWEIHGCPVQGPAIDAGASTPAVVVAWLTAARDEPRVQVAFSHDSGRSFDPPIVVDSEDPIGRVSVSLENDGAAWVSWLARSDGAAKVTVAKVDAQAGVGPREIVGSTSAARASGVPRLIRHRDSLWLTWIELSPSGDRRLRVSLRSHD